MPDEAAIDLAALQALLPTVVAHSTTPYALL